MAAAAVFRSTISKGLADMNDPEGIAGRIPACASDAKRIIAKSAMQTALTNLDQAQVHRTNNNKVGYWLRMREVFGDDFPMPTW